MRGKEPEEDKVRNEQFKKCRDKIATKFLADLDSTITGGKIATLTENTGGVKIHWNKNFRTTAGRANCSGTCRYRRNRDGVKERVGCNYRASIDLAEKIVTDEDRLRDTLAHEFCHLTTYMISEVHNNPHGKEFQAWGKKVTRAFRGKGVKVTTKHSYDIDFKYVWECMLCGAKYGRHSKSLDVEGRVCGLCRGWLAQTKPPETTPLPKGEATQYRVFVQHWFGKIRGDDPSMKNNEVIGVITWMYTKRMLKDDRNVEKDGLQRNSANTPDVFARKGLDVTTRNSPDVDHNSVWECMLCGVEYKGDRESVDVEKQRCGRCKGWLAQTEPVQMGTTNGYLEFLQQWFGRIRSRHPSTRNDLIIEAIALKYTEQTPKNRANVVRNASGRQDLLRDLEKDFSQALTKKMEIVDVFVLGRVLDVTTKNSSDVDFGFVWECMRCGVEYKGHSRSLDVETQKCGRCNGYIALIEPRPTVKVNGYEGFSQKLFRRIRKENPSMKNDDINKVIDETYKELVLKDNGHVGKGALKEEDSMPGLTKGMKNIALND